MTQVPIVQRSLLLDGRADLVRVGDDHDLALAYLGCETFEPFLVGDVDAALRELASEAYLYVRLNTFVMYACRDVDRILSRSSYEARRLSFEVGVHLEGHVAGHYGWEVSPLTSAGGRAGCLRFRFR
jgi:hypothetical protein